MSFIRIASVAFFLFLFSLSAFAQRDTTYNKKETVSIGNNKYKKWNNWVSAGAGWCRNFNNGRDQFVLGGDFNFHIQKEYFNIGINLIGDDFGNYNNYEYHISYGKRKESAKFNFAAFAGPSYSTGYQWLGTRYDADPFNQFGLYGATQLIYKFKYDIGIGVTLFCDYNPLQTFGGFRFDLYFSGAYAGEVRKTKFN
jgi:hypothetical protein